ncbi:VWA domain-containing protein [Siminovitchia fortis]|uniref:VWA domain-containing protein n=2 Tax=Siminovitchia fortis TaxID=254758 RepID=A0A443IP48_9BACI|nr:VWA domain-containing protein [Siminovitchia fortis]
MMMPKKAFIVIVLFCLALAGCQQTEKKSEQKKEEKAVEANAKESKEKEEASYSLKGEEIEKEPAGELFQQYIGDKEFADNEEYSKAAGEAVAEYMKEIKNMDTKDWDAEQWAKSIILSLRTDVSGTIQPLKDFEVKYNELKLPDGRLLQDVSEEELNEEADDVNVAVLIDASGSMKADVPGGNKMALAKSSIKQFSESLPDNVNVSLSVFGHKGTGSDQDKKLSCESIETVYSLKPYDQKEFSNALDQFNASGWTPLASAIQQAEKELKVASGDKTKTLIYVVSDGVETCDGDPVQAAKNAKKSMTDLQINIIGFDVDNEADRQLKEVASAGGGEYTSVKNKQELDDEITKNWKESLGKTTWRFWLAGNINNINWASVGMSNELRGLENNHITSRNREHDRMKAALNELLSSDLVDLDTKSAISDILFERTNAIKDYADGIKSEKHNEIFDTAESLKEKVDHVTKDLDL